MSTYRLKSLFAPWAIAVVGASRRELSLGRIVLENLRGAGFKGPIHLVNPRYQEIEGQATVPNIESIDPPPDLMIVTTPAAMVAALVASAICWRPARRAPLSCGPRSPRRASTPSMCYRRRKRPVTKSRWAPPRH